MHALLMSKLTAVAGAGSSALCKKMLLTRIIVEGQNATHVELMHSTINKRYYPLNNITRCAAASRKGLPEARDTLVVACHCPCADTRT